MKRDVNRLRILRAERRLTQTAIWKRTGIQASRLSLLENGHVQPSEAESHKLARVFRLAIKDIFPGDAGSEDTVAHRRCSDA